jgi:hypothetical protein
MKFGKTKIAITYALLLYFLCFIVPPVSSILPSADSFVDTNVIAAIGKDTTRERMYLFDLTLWELLKRAKRSDNVTAVLPQGSEDRRQYITDQVIGIIESGPNMLSMLTVSACHVPNNKSHDIAGFPFAPSGLSPPVFA